MRLFPAAQKQCTCIGLPSDFDMSKAWIAGGRFIQEQSEKIDQCIQNGGVLEPSR
jgi:hypothetical protein